MEVKIRKFIFAACTALPSVFVAAKQLPPDVYETWGICPFECCTYGEWIADARIPVYEKRSEQSEILFRLNPGEPADGLTGVVVTKNPAPIYIDRPIRDGFREGNETPLLALKPGHIVYFLASLGEGFYTFWYEGEVYQSGEALAALPGPKKNRMTSVWWKQVRNKAGQTGWTRSQKFQKMDSCE